MKKPGTQTGLTWDELEELLLGKLRLSWDEMYMCNIRININRMRGYYSEVESKIKESWERDRYFAICLMNIHIKHPLKKPTDLVRFAWEKQQKPIQLTAEQFNKFVNNG